MPAAPRCSRRKPAGAAGDGGTAGQAAVLSLHAQVTGSVSGPFKAHASQAHSRIIDASVYDRRIIIVIMSWCWLVLGLLLGLPP